MRAQRKKPSDPNQPLIPFVADEGEDDVSANDDASGDKEETSDEGRDDDGSSSESSMCSVEEDQIGCSADVSQPQPLSVSAIINPPIQPDGNDLDVRLMSPNLRLCRYPLS